MDVVNRTTKEYRPSVNTPDYPVAEWIHDPDLSAVAGWPSRYWIITGDVITLMTQAERDAVDAALLEAARDGLVQATVDDLEDIIRATVQVLRDELNLHADKHNAILSAIDSSANFGAMKTAIAAIPDYPQRTLAQLRTAIRNKLGT